MKHNNLTVKIVTAFALSLSVSGVSAGDDAGLRLHYDHPAGYFEEALVIGNGTLGATVYGGVREDKISLNDLTLWTGEPDRQVTTPGASKAIPEIRALLDKEDYKGADRAQRKVQGHFSENYQPVGTLTINHLSGGEVARYRRWLDIGDATAHTEYTRDGKAFSCDYFASAPDSVIVIRLKSDDAQGLQAVLSFDSPLPHAVSAMGSELSVEGYAAWHSYPSYYKIADKHLYDPERGIHFRTLVKVIAPGGEVKSFPAGTLKITGCREAVVLITNVTSFNGFDKDPVKEGRDYRRAAERRIAAASAKAYADLLNAHITDYRHFFNRLSVNLGQTPDSVKALPTDVQLRRYTDLHEPNPELEALYLQFGRYLLISSSRTPGVPANLQGLWNERILPPWSCNYTTNINLEENYWAAETANLSEMHAPLFDFIRNLSKNGRTSARAYYGIDKGWCLGHNTDIWAMTNPVGLNTGDPSWANWTMGGAWLSTHIWEHYLFTKDKDFLKTNYPALKGAAEFCLDWLVEKDGRLLTSPGTSPENKFVTPDGYVGATSYGNTSDLAMTRECLLDCLAAAGELGRDKPLQKRINSTLKKLLPYRVGKAGNLQEWFHDWKDQNPQHRHQSHLFGLYPGHHISPETTPALAKACARSLEIKGDQTTGWSAGWRVNLWARLKDGKNAYHLLQKLLTYVSPDDYQGKDARRGGGTYPNLLDAHSPFQIDGNFGGCAGMIEMLVQSSPDRIELLPALPAQWRDGCINGVKTRGGFTVDMQWKDAKVVALKVSSEKGGSTTVRFNGESRKVKLKAGASCKVL